MGGSFPIKVFKVRFRSELFLLIMAVCSTQAVLIGTIIWNLNMKRLFEIERDNLTQLLNVVNQDLESRVEAINSIALDIAINSEVKNGLNKTDSLELGRSKAMINSILSKKFLSASNELLDISIIDRRLNTYSTRAIYFLPKDFSLANTDVFKQAQEFNGALRWLDENSIIDRYCGDSIFPSSHMGGLRSAALINDYSRGEILGLLMISVKDDFFFNINYSNNKLEKVCMFLLSPDQKTILAVAESNSDSRQDIISRIDTEAERGGFVMKDPDSTLVSYIRNNAMGWTLVSTVSSADIRRPFSFVWRTLFFVLLFSLAASTLISWLLSIVFSKGVADLASTMKEVEKGRFDVRVNSHRNDEIGWLSDVFDHMVLQIKELIEKTYTQKLLMQQAEFRALQAQINPHFLYNTLDMFKWRLLNKGETEISGSIIELGRMLQYTISASGIVSLEDEIQNIRDYIALRQSNKDPEFECHIETIEGHDVYLPKLTLQPLVENAILHGFYGRRFNNVLIIRGYPSFEDLYRIDIEDNGIGIEEEQLQSIHSRLTTLIAADKDRSHIGLINVLERLKIMLGDTCGLFVESKFGYGTKIIVIVRRGELSNTPQSYGT